MRLQDQRLGQRYFATGDEVYGSGYTRWNLQSIGVATRTIHADEERAIVQAVKTGPA